MPEAAVDVGVGADAEEAEVVVVVAEEAFPVAVVADGAIRGHLEEEGAAATHGPPEEGEAIRGHRAVEEAIRGPQAGAHRGHPAGAAHRGHPAGVAHRGRPAGVAHRGHPAETLPVHRRAVHPSLVVVACRRSHHSGLQEAIDPAKGIAPRSFRRRIVLARAIAPLSSRRGRAGQIAPVARIVPGLELLAGLRSFPPTDPAAALQIVPAAPGLASSRALVELTIFSESLAAL